MYIIYYSDANCPQQPNFASVDFFPMLWRKKTKQKEDPKGRAKSGKLVSHIIASNYVIGKYFQNVRMSSEY